jgi:broad specificity phosphatase PhoE
VVSEENILVYLVRHGETNLNKEHRFRGSIDAPLDAEGFRDANRLATYFKNIDVSHIFTSPRKRTSATASIIGLMKGVRPIENQELVAWDIGDFGGEEKTEENMAALHYYVDHPEVPPPGGEALDQFRARIHPLVEEAIECADASGKPIMIVCHSSVVHEASAYITGDHMACKIKPGGVSAIYVGPGNMLYAEPILRPDKDSSTQNVLGTGTHLHIQTIS